MRLPAVARASSASVTHWNARRSHPTEDHFAPFFVALGAGGWPARRLELGFDLGTLGLDGYVFGE